MMSKWLIQNLMAFSFIALVACDLRGPNAAGLANQPHSNRDDRRYIETIPGSTVQFTMVRIPEGVVDIEATADARGGEKKSSAASVRIEAFYMGECEVTWPEYQLFMDGYLRLRRSPAQLVPTDPLADAVTYPTPIDDWQDIENHLSRMGGQGAGYPAIGMSQYAARQYTKWLSKKTGRFYRLPTEAEWDYACRGGTKTTYFFGNDPASLPDYAWFEDNSDVGGEPSYHKAKLKKPNPFGLYDIYGNVAEWCIDAYDADWFSKIAGKGVLTVEQATNWPYLQKAAFPGALRGGSFNSPAADCRSGARIPATKELVTNDSNVIRSVHWLSRGFWVGFRVVSPVREPTVREMEQYWDLIDEQTAQRLKFTEDKQVRGKAE